MSENLKNNSENNNETNNYNPYDSLTEMGGSFNPDKAKAAREEALEAKHILDDSKHRKEEYLKSDLGQQEESIEETFDRWYNDIDEMVKSGQMTEEQAREMLNAMTESAIEGIDTVRQEYATQQELVGHEDVQKKLESIENGLGKEFDGETNINDATGKERTFSEWDIQPKLKDETSREFGDRAIKRGDITVLTEHVPKFQDESPEEYSKRIDQLHSDFLRKEGEGIEQYRERIEAADKNNDLLISEANHIIPSGTELAQKIIDEMSNIKDMQQSGRFDETKAKQFQRELLQQAIEDQRELDRNKMKEEKRAQLKEQLQQKRELENDALEEQPIENEKEPINEQYNTDTITPQVQQAPQEQTQQAPPPAAKKKPGLFGRIRGFFGRRRQARAERLRQAQAEEQAQQAQRAEQIKQQRMADYKAEHPGAIEDIAKAEAMAYAGDPYRTEAIKNRKRADAFLEGAKTLHAQGQDAQAYGLANTSKILRESALESNAFATVMEEAAGHQYDNQHNPDQARRDAVAEYLGEEQPTNSNQDDGATNANKKIA